MTNVEILTAEEARRRRADLLAQLPFSEDELRKRAAAYQLTADEDAILDQVDELDFLLGK